MKLEEVPLNCRICKHFLDDKESFMEEHGTQYICGFNMEPKLLGFGCEEAELGFWTLVEFLKELMKK